MNTHKAFIHKVTPRFELKVMVELGEGILHGETLALRGLDLPKPGSQAGRALRKHLKRVRDSVEFVAVQKHEKNAFLRRNTDVFYPPSQKTTGFARGAPSPWGEGRFQGGGERAVSEQRAFGPAVGQTLR